MSNYIRHGGGKMQEYEKDSNALKINNIADEIVVQLSNNWVSLFALIELLEEKGIITREEFNNKFNKLESVASTPIMSLLEKI